MSVMKLGGAAPLLRVESPITSWSPATIDLRGLTWATPFDICALGLLWSRLLEAGNAPEVLLPEERAVRAYLVDAGLADVIPGPWNVVGASGVAPPLVRLTRLHDPEEWDDMASDILAGAHAALGDPELTRRTFGILSELIDNATTHGSSSAGTFVCAQRYSGQTSGLSPGVWLGIADGGRGIPSHLRLNPKYQDIERDEELIRMARRPWVTGTRDRRGWGLVEVFVDAAAVGPGEVLIRSGRGAGYFRVREGFAPYARYQGGLRPAVPGAWVHLMIDAG